MGMWAKILTICLTLITVSCAFSSPPVTLIGQEANGNEQIKSPPGDSSELVIKSVEFFAWEEGGPKKKYVKLERLKLDDKRNVPPGNTFDVILKMENKSARTAIQYQDLIALTNLEFVITNEKPANNDISTFIKKHGWTRVMTVDDIKMVILPYIAPMEQTQITLRGFDLNDFVKIVKEDELELRPRVLKLNIHILNREMKQELYKEAVLQVSP